jgi:hypothetical protein
VYHFCSLGRVSAIEALPFQRLLRPRAAPGREVPGVHPVPPAEHPRAERTESAGDAAAREDDKGQDADPLDEVLGGARGQRQLVHEQKRHYTEHRTPEVACTSEDDGE